LLQCKAKDCRKQFSVKIGTIFEDSPLPLSSWFVAVWCIANAKNGISSCEVGRALGVTQKTAWFMMHRIRLAMATPTFRRFRDIVESDETFIGGKAENMHAAKRARKIIGRGPVGKAIVHGILERGNAEAEKVSQVRATVVPNTEAETLIPEILQNVEPDAIVCTDSTASYRDLCSRFIHKAVDHGLEYVRGKVHVNGMENFWSLVKRMLKGTYVAVAPFHLFRYLDEESWRFNWRKQNDGERFREVMRNVLDKRISFRVLCAIDDAGFMGIT
jgi:transposase-like protein